MSIAETSRLAMILQQTDASWPGVQISRSFSTCANHAGPGLGTMLVSVKHRCRLPQTGGGAFSQVPGCPVLERIGGRLGRWLKTKIPRFTSAFDHPRRVAPEPRLSTLLCRHLENHPFTLLCAWDALPPPILPSLILSQKRPTRYSRTNND